MDLPEIANGNICLIWVVAQTGNTRYITSVTSGWNLIAHPNSGGNSCRGGVIWRQFDGTEGASVAQTWNSNPGSRLRSVIYEISNFDEANPIINTNGVQAQDGNSYTWNMSGVTTVKDNSPILMFAGGNNIHSNTSVTAGPAGRYQVQNFPYHNGRKYEFQGLMETAGDTGAVSYGWSNSGRGCYIELAINPA